MPPTDSESPNPGPEGFNQGGAKGNHPGSGNGPGNSGPGNLGPGKMGPGKMGPGKMGPGPKGKGMGPGPGPGPGQGPGPGGPDGPPMGRPTLGASLHELKFYFPYLKPVKLHIVAVVVLSFLGSLLALPAMSLPKVLLSQFDEGQEKGWFLGAVDAIGGENYIVVYLFIALGCMVVGAAALMARTLFSSRASEHVLRTLRQKLFGQIEHLPMSAVYSAGAGRYVQNMSRDVFQIRAVIGDTLTQTVEWVLRLFVYVGWLLVLEPVLTLILLAILGIAIPIVRACNRRVESWAGKVRELSEQILNQLVEVVGGYRDLKAAGRFGQMAEKFSETTAVAEKQGIRTVMWSQLAAQTVSITTSVMMVLPYFIYKGDLSSPGTLGELLTYTWVLSQVFPVIRMLTFVSADIAVAAPSMRSVREILETEPPPMPSFEGVDARPQALTPLQSIRFENVGVQLGGRWIVRELNFEIPGEKMTAIVGESGSGKTTIFNLLVRLLQPTEGRILINDCPLAAIDEVDLRELIGYIPQNPFVFNSTIRDNLLVDPGTKVDFNSIIDGAQLTHMIGRRESEGGLDAPTGFQGMKLSAGERQRVALARLLIQDPPIIISDEYTANIDMRTARIIQDMMRREFNDRTRVTISHELYSVKGADHIVVLNHGRVERAGSHHDLINVEGLYRDLWEAQSLTQ